MTFDYEQYYQPKPAEHGWDGERSSRWRQLGATVKVDHVMQLFKRAGIVSTDGLAVLEVGCGDGHVLAELAHRGFGPELVGVEVSETAAQLARGHP
jgi:tRNA G46 methylase TrmB